LLRACACETQALVADEFQAQSGCGLPHQFFAGLASATAQPVVEVGGGNPPALLSRQRRF